ncbi:MAG: hypothetical protein K8H87_14395, partial [Pseudorhodoplanes sp.]|nr:hypothetical protein [Pseudorhodoplanes sp.]
RRDFATSWSWPGLVLAWSWLAGNLSAIRRSGYRFGERSREKRKNPDRDPIQSERITVQVDALLAEPASCSCGDNVIFNAESMRSSSSPERKRRPPACAA